MKIKGKNIVVPQECKALITWSPFYLCFLFGDDGLQMFLEPIKLNNSIDTIIYIYICVYVYIYIYIYTYIYSNLLWYKYLILCNLLPKVSYMMIQVIDFSKCKSHLTRKFCMD